MELYFVRHGIAEEREQWAPQPDHLRPLTAEGITRMRKSATTIKALGVRPAAILTSPMTRARQTADILAEALDCVVTEVEALASFSIDALTELLDHYPTADSLLLVGHEPDFSAVIGMLIGGGQVVVKKGSLIRVDLYASHPPRGHLSWLIPPKALLLR